MGIFEHLPYTNNHDLNLDWIIAKMKELIVNVQAQDDKIAAVEQLAAELKEFVETYFDNLDVQVEINRKIDAMVRDGTMLALVSGPSATAAGAWLADHLTFPTNPPIDTSLTVANAAADAKATGDAISAANAWQWVTVLNEYMLEDGMLVNGTGFARPSAQRVRTIYIPMKQGSTIACNDIRFNVWEFNISTKEYIRDIGGWANTWTVTQDCFVRIMWQNTQNYTYAQIIAATQVHYPRLYHALLNPSLTQQDIASETSYNRISLNKASDWKNAAYNANGYYTRSNTVDAAIRPTAGIMPNTRHVMTWGNVPFATDVSTAFIYVHFCRADGTRISYNRYDATEHIARFATPSDCVLIGISTYGETCTDWHLLIPEFVQVEEGIIPTMPTYKNVLPYSMINKGKLFNDVKGLYYDEVLTNDFVRSIAHRGNVTFAPQNTAPAYIIARQMNFKYAENDLALTDDGYFVMWHDTTLSRLGNLIDLNGYPVYHSNAYHFYYLVDNQACDYTNGEYVPSGVAVSTLTRSNGADFGVNSDYGAQGIPFDTLRRIDFGAYVGPKFAHTQIMTYAEWLGLCRKLGLHAYVDKKLTYTDSLLNTALFIAQRIGMDGHITFLGLTPEQMTTALEMLPHCEFGVLANPSAELVARYYNFKEHFRFNGDASELTQEMVNLAHAEGMKVECYLLSVEHALYYKQEISRLVGMGVDGLTLDGIRVEDAFSDMLHRYWS